MRVRLCEGKERRRGVSDGVSAFVCCLSPSPKIIVASSGTENKKMWHQTCKRETPPLCDLNKKDR